MLGYIKVMGLRVPVTDAMMEEAQRDFDYNVLRGDDRNEGDNWALCLEVVAFEHRETAWPPIEELLDDDRDIPTA